MSINKFGFSPKGQNKNDMPEHSIVKIVENVISQQKYKYVTLNSEGNYEASNKKIENIANPVYDSDAANKKYVEAVVWSELDKYFQKDIDMKYQRIKNLRLPLENDDAVTKGYVDNSIYHGYSVLWFRLKPGGKEKNKYVIKPHGTTEYVFPFDADIKLSKTNLNPAHVEVMKNENVILFNFFDGNLHFFHKGSTLSFRYKDESKAEENSFVEIVYRTTV